MLWRAERSGTLAAAVFQRLGKIAIFRPMTTIADSAPPTRGHPPPAAPIARGIAEGRDWRIAEYVCSAGPGDRAFEERHEAFTVAAVLEGTFRYRAETGASLLYPGAFLLGNFGTCYECGHDHSRGDRCLALHFAPDYFAEVAAAVGGRGGKFKFRTGMLPASAASLSWLAPIQSTIGRREPLELAEAVAGLIEGVVVAAAGALPSRQRVSASDERRISAALHRLEHGFADVITLDQLAELARMSKYHFLRTFRRVVGMPPHRYLLGLRLRHAATRLAASGEAVSTIAFDAGFGDLSTFNAHFRDQFGSSPSRYRARVGPRRKNSREPQCRRRSTA
jgi:AraC-like DNA-binding protein